MKYVLGLTHKEMAKNLQLSINSIGSLLSRGKKNLKGMLET
jgi:DNA-directed RNA polymerase specialized sigma24 family protein